MVCDSGHRWQPLDVALSADSVGPMNIFRDAVVSVLGLCVIVTCVAPVFAAREEMSAGVQEVMSPGEFKAAGLNKLSPEELQKLNAWLQGYREVRSCHQESYGAGRESNTPRWIFWSAVWMGLLTD